MAIDTPARIAVLGAGPIGLEAALYARYLGYEVDLYERGRAVEHVQQWGHVQLFTPFDQNSSPLGVAALRAQDSNWLPPRGDALLTGREMAAAYWLPLARSDLLVDGLHTETEVLAIGREQLIRGELAGDETRGDGLFRLLVASRGPDGQRAERIATADVVIDCTGTYGHHNWLGEGGIPALGELAAAAHIEYGLADVLGRHRERYAGRNMLVVGDGHSAATTVVALVQLARECPDTWITWVTRPDRDDEGNPVPRAQPIATVANDPLPQRLNLARAANTLAAKAGDHLTYHPATHVELLAWHGERFIVRLAGAHAGELEVDRVIANIGYSADHRLSAQLHVASDFATGAIATQHLRETGVEDAAAPRAPQQLITAEPNFYVLGAKSCGCRSDFLITTGLAQVRALFAIIGDRAELDLYATMQSLCGGPTR